MKLALALKHALSMVNKLALKSLGCVLKGTWTEYRFFANITTLTLKVHKVCQPFPKLLISGLRPGAPPFMRHEAEMAVISQLFFSAHFRFRHALSLYLLLSVDAYIFSLITSAK